MEQLLCNGLPCDGPVFDSQWEESKNRVSRPSQETVNGGWGVISLNDLAVNVPLRAATNESKKTLNKCETLNKTVFHTRLRHPETINSVPLNSVLRIKQIGV